MAAGFYREVAPPADLAPYVACTWTRVVASAHREPVIPDACADIIVVADHPAHLAGPADRAEWITLDSGTTVTGLRFRPGAAADVLRADMRDLRNTHTDLVDIVGASAHDLARDLDRDHPERALLAWVRARLARPRTQTVHDLARVFAATPSVDDATALLGWSPRRLHRHVTATCGYGPKLLQRILRLQRALRLAFARTPLAAVASAAGYADQAHMTREFVDLTGLPPTAYLACADPRVGTWLVSDLFKTPAPR